MSSAKTLRPLLSQNEQLLLVPGVHDALSARLASKSGARALFMSGYGVAASMGYPDLGLLTMDEMLGVVRRISEAVNIPLIADADTGYGNALNVFRTVREYEKAGAAAIQLEDQTWPKRCGYMSGKAVIGTADMVEKITAAVDARRDSNTVLVIRTDAVGCTGFEPAMERVGAYVQAGADAIFVAAPEDREQLAQTPARAGKPCVINMALPPKGVTLEDIKRFGFALAIFPLASLLPFIDGCTWAYKELLNNKRFQTPLDYFGSFREMNLLLGSGVYWELEEKAKASISDRGGNHAQQ